MNKMSPKLQELIGLPRPSPLPLPPPLCWRVSVVYLQHIRLQIYDVLRNYFDRFVCMQRRESNNTIRYHLQTLNLPRRTLERKICRFAKQDITHLACRLMLISPAIATREGSRVSYVCQTHAFIREAAEGFRAFSLFANDFIPALLGYISQN